MKYCRKHEQAVLFGRDHRGLITLMINGGLAKGRKTAISLRDAPSVNPGTFMLGRVGFLRWANDPFCRS
jgi:hypothetical protein